MRTPIIVASALLASAAWLVPANAQVPSGAGTTPPKSAMPPAFGESHSGKDTSDVANGPTAGRNTPMSRSEGAGSAIPPSSNTPVVGQVRPAPSSRFNSGVAETGNSTEGNGQLGASGAGASATMQNGHLNNR